MDKEGNNVQLIIENIKHYFYIVDNYIYYIDKDSRSVYRANIDGQNKIEIAKGRNIINAVTDKYLAYTDNSCYVDNELQYPVIEIIFFDTNEHFRFDNPNGFYANENEIYFYTRTYNKTEYGDIESIGRLFEVNLESSKVIEKWSNEEDSGMEGLIYTYKEMAYFENYPKTFRINIDNKNERRYEI